MVLRTLGGRRAFRRLPRHGATTLNLDTQSARQFAERHTVFHRQVVFLFGIIFQVVELQWGRCGRHETGATKPYRTSVGVSRNTTGLQDAIFRSASVYPRHFPIEMACVWAGGAHASGLRLNESFSPAGGIVGSSNGAET